MYLRAIQNKLIDERRKESEKKEGASWLWKWLKEHSGFIRAESL
jgi:hypothetical protein